MCGHDHMSPLPAIALRWGVILTVLAALALPVRAAPFDMVITAPPQPPVAGAVARFTVYLTNTGTSPVDVDMPGQLPVVLDTADGSVNTALTAESSPAPPKTPLAPGAHTARTYRLDLPRTLKGPVTLRTLAPETAVRFLVLAAPAAPPPTTAENIRTDMLADNFYGHDPVYFLYGPNPDHAKFQISFKYRIVNAKGALGRKWPKTANIYFGYTQTSFWDWTSDSAPFFDSIYKPEVFYFEPDIRQAWLPFVDSLDFHAGLQHASNGKDGATSRSLNNVYIKAKATIGNRLSPHVTVAPRLWTYVGDLSDNPDIDRYLGYFDIELAYEMPKGFKVSALLRKGAGAGKGSLQIDATYPLSRFLLGSLDLYAQIQYFTGYGETLLHYNEQYSFLRFGFAVYR